ncbi:MAG: C-type lectin domain-containing protein [Deltaproteobacteria bacterium]|nr:C-type lectin domain-containing protein [Deltaproteobacteria bacterium]
MLPGDSYEAEVYVSPNADPSRLSFLIDPTTQPWSSGTINAPQSGVFLAELGAGSAMCGYGWRVLDLVGFSRHNGGEENWFASMAWGGTYPTAPRGGFDNHWDPWMTTGRTVGYVPSTEAFVADVTHDGGDDALWYIDAADGGPAWVVGVSLFTTCGRVDPDNESVRYKAFDDPGKVLASDDLGRLLETPLTFSDGAVRRLVGDINDDGVTDLLALDSAGAWQIQLMTPPCLAMPDAPSGARWALCRGRTSWDQASADCKTKGGALAHPSSAADHLALSLALDAVTLDGSSLRAWIGLSDRAAEGNFVWEDGAALDTVMSSYWRSGSPSSSDGAKDCVFVDSLELAGDGAYLMKDTQCSSETALGATSAYVCEIDR